MSDPCFWTDIVFATETCATGDVDGPIGVWSPEVLTKFTGGDGGSATARFLFSGGPVTAVERRFDSLSIYTLPGSIDPGGSDGGNPCTLGAFNKKLVLTIDSTIADGTTVDSVKFSGFSWMSLAGFISAGWTLQGSATDVDMSSLLRSGGYDYYFGGSDLANMCGGLVLETADFLDPATGDTSTYVEPFLAIGVIRDVGTDVTHIFSMLSGPPCS